MSDEINEKLDSIDATIDRILAQEQECADLDASVHDWIETLRANVKKLSDEKKALRRELREQKQRIDQLTAKRDALAAALVAGRAKIKEYLDSLMDEFEELEREYGDMAHKLSDGRKLNDTMDRLCAIREAMDESSEIARATASRVAAWKRVVVAANNLIDRITCLVPLNVDWRKERPYEAALDAALAALDAEAGE